MTNLELWQQQCEGLTPEEKHRFAHCMIGAVAVSVDPKIWADCMDIARPYSIIDKIRGESVND